MNWIYIFKRDVSQSVTLLMVGLLGSAIAVPILAFRRPAATMDEVAVVTVVPLILAYVLVRIIDRLVAHLEPKPITPPRSFVEKISIFLFSLSVPVSLFGLATGLS